MIRPRLEKMPPSARYGSKGAARSMPLGSPFDGCSGHLIARPQSSTHFPFLCFSCMSRRAPKACFFPEPWLSPTSRVLLLLSLLCQPRSSSRASSQHLCHSALTNVLVALPPYELDQRQTPFVFPGMKQMEPILMHQESHPIELAGLRAWSLA
jgi:hypothetical protein